MLPMEAFSSSTEGAATTWSAGSGLILILNLFLWSSSSSDSSEEKKADFLGASSSRTSRKASCQWSASHWKIKVAKDVWLCEVYNCSADEWNEALCFSGKDNSKLPLVDVNKSTHYEGDHAFTPHLQKYTVRHQRDFLFTFQPPMSHSSACTFVTLHPLCWVVKVCPLFVRQEFHWDFIGLDDGQSLAVNQQLPANPLRNYFVEMLQ